jgi:hypothetical protein
VTWDEKIGWIFAQSHGGPQTPPSELWREICAGTSVTDAQFWIMGASFLVGGLMLIRIIERRLHK